MAWGPLWMGVLHLTLPPVPSSASPARGPRASLPTRLVPTRDRSSCAQPPCGLVAAAVVGQMPPAPPSNPALPSMPAQAAGLQDPGRAGAGEHAAEHPARGQPRRGGADGPAPRHRPATRHPPQVSARLPLPPALPCCQHTGARRSRRGETWGGQPCRGYRGGEIQCCGCWHRVQIG